MDMIVLEAFNIVKGEVNGDEFLWDHEYRDPKSGLMMRGIWKSYLESQRNARQ